MADLLLEMGADRVIESNQNQIKFINFMVQGQRNGILQTPTKIKVADSCSKTPGKNDYYLLYYYLVKKDIIKSEYDKTTMFTWDKVDTVNPDTKLLLKLINTLNRKDDDYPNEIKCFVLNKKKLYDFLKTYKYDASDELKMFQNNEPTNKTGGTKRRKNRKPRKTSKKK